MAAVGETIPHGWQKVQIGELGAGQRPVLKAGPFGSAVTKATYRNTGYKVYGQQEVLSGDLNAEQYYISEDVYQRISSCSVQPGDVLITMMGTVGKVLEIPESAEEGVINPRLMRISVDRSRVLPGFLVRQLNSWPIQKLLHNRAHGGTMPGLNADAISTISLLLPPLSEQHRIANILSTWDRAIETVDALIARAREQKAAVRQALLTGRARLPSFHDHWSWSKFSDVFERVSEKNTIGDTNVLTISAQHGLISQTEYFNKVVASDDVRGYTLLQRGDFAYNKSYSEGYPFGAFKPLDRYDRGIVSSLYICFRLASSGHDHDFMRHYFEAGRFNREVAAIAQEGARNHGLLNVSIVDFFDASLHTPSLAEQQAISAVVNDAERKEKMLLNQREALRQEKAALMQQLLTGKRRVDTAESEAA